ncbi:hypothetical protein GCM10025882_19360 [Acinetobacter gyllenbergii]|uniref:DUF3325 domain-containing protein n=1 Tax=Acinetobacter gyllenbergii CIP 110306 = MTCC 11365 TaxID=1217657 RepID=A0A829HFQ1_9GAMM|nr:DUF3325 domain-containing protein [Acinetobacter gyllenbergii]EPF79691.1 hypothetical protein F957_02557 [Acinetobacter gyllenbergii CIP 110306 = MTCC 11365]EPH32946.1 hypothetical protein L293_1123 [Acinetobacter gyllenbergii CIP 110306 = MTCC 11365]ESK49094.1 hypothetical protein F987_01733 [Acinetobacter gyllenbergii NIPH 230]MCU4582138.1 DUF3325 domain-containing protein [Acinetobacter gyllenbergii]OBY76032.1 hypothetical protein NG55_05015 [Acinetobacter gyllenbergii]
MAAMMLWCVAVVALSALACGMSKHQRDIFSSQISAQTSRCFEITGWVILLISALVMIYLKGASVGLSEWLGCITFAALAVGLLLTYQPKKLLQANVIMTVLFGLMLIVTLI